MSLACLVLRIRRDRRGASSIEMAFICSLIVIAIVASVRGLADENTGMWARVSSKSVDGMQGQ